MSGTEDHHTILKKENDKHLETEINTFCNIRLRGIIYYMGLDGYNCEEGIELHGETRVKP